MGRYIYILQAVYVENMGFQGFVATFRVFMYLYRKSIYAW